MPADRVTRITAVRSEYTSARHICANLEHRAHGRTYRRPAGYLPPAIDYGTRGGRAATIHVRDYDVRFLERVATRAATEHLDLIHRARLGEADARAELRRHARRLQPEMSARFVKADLAEDAHVIPYTTERHHPVTEISSKGAVLLDLSRKGFATPDFTFLTASVYPCSPEERRRHARRAIRNLEVLSGRRFGDADNPLLVAMRTAMPRYLPGFMPTYLNVGYVPAMLPGLPRRYGEDAAARIRLNNRRNLLEALAPAVSRSLEHHIRPDLGRERNEDLVVHIESLIAARRPELLDDPFAQVDFFLEQAYAYYDRHFDALRNFMDDEVRYPTVILQRMVCSVMDRDSYAGVLYSRHPRLGRGVHLQYARTIYGEDLMTGRLRPEETHLRTRDDAHDDFPAVHHFWPRLAQLERIFGAPVMVEFTGVHGTFTILQVNQAQLAGSGMLTAVMELHRADEIDAARVRRLIEPFHLRQLESDAIDPRSLHDLRPFAHGLSVLPRTAVSGRLALSPAALVRLRRDHPGDRVILCQPRFVPTDVVSMQQTDGILSLSPAAIHVVTTAQTMGIPALLDLARDGVRIAPDGDALVRTDGATVTEGEWVTISSRQKTLYVGAAVFTAARLMRYLDGEPLDLTADERTRFDALAHDYRDYQQLLAQADAEDFASLQELGRAARSGSFRAEPALARAFAQRCFAHDAGRLVAALFDTTLGQHLNNQTALALLDDAQQVQLLTAVAALAAERELSGYQAGSFVIGSLVNDALTADQWAQLPPPAAAYLVNEWVLHRKYRDLVADVGERRLHRARSVLLGEGLGDLHLHPGMLAELLPLKLSGVDLDALRGALPDRADPQSGDVLALLGEPWAAFVDFGRPDARRRLQRLCARHGRPLPSPEER